MEDSVDEIQLHSTVGEVVASQPGLARFFEERRVDYCCGGKKTLAHVCEENQWDPQEFAASLSQAAQGKPADNYVDAATMSLSGLADHIEQTHHAYLRKELPRLLELAEKVSTVHGAKDARLYQVNDVLVEFANELYSHMTKEEVILFPLIRQLEAPRGPLAFHCGSVANPIRQMEHEHDVAGAALEKLRTLTDDLSPPDDACNTYRVLLDSLAQLESDMHQHVHKENNVLFPRALKLE
jgi:regulator of cell morphogenesis and NO signaling